MTSGELAALRALEPLCWRAPSAHNTQPWTLTYHADRVAVGWNPACGLPAGDPDGRDLRLSLGAFVETCLIASADAGLAVAYIADHDEGQLRIGWLVGASEPYSTPFNATTIARRASSRSAYHPAPVDDAILAELRAFAVSAGCDVRTIDQAALAPLVARADRAVFDSPPLTRELRAWLRLSRRHPRYWSDGLTDRTLELTRAQARALQMVLSDVAYPLLRRIGLSRALAAAATVPPGGSVLALVGPIDSTPDLEVTFGRVLQRMWLALADRDVATHPLSQVIDFAPTRLLLHRTLDLRQDEHVLNIARIGRPRREPARSARRVGYRMAQPDAEPPNDKGES